MSIPSIWFRYVTLSVTRFDKRNVVASCSSGEERRKEERNDRRSNRRNKGLVKRIEGKATNLGSRVGDQLRSVEIVAVERGAARIAVSSWTGAQRLGKVQSNVNRIANLLNRAFWQQVDVLIMRIIMILGRLCQSCARTLR